MPSRSAQSTRRIVVALDGPASSGKSSVGAAAAEQLQLRFVDTGLFYRALTALALLEGVALDDPAILVPLVDRVSLGDDGSGRFTRVLLDGSDATDEARSALVDGSVSTVARVPEVRAALLERQRDLAADGGIVMAGRDVGTVVLPDADLKLFLDASVEERARRRIDERGLDPDGAEADEVREQLRTRDAIDTGRAVAPLRAADDAVHVLTDGNAFDETVEIVAAEIAGVMLTPRPRTRTPKAPGAAVVAEVAQPDPEATPRAKRTRASKAAAAAVSEPKPKRVRKPKAPAEPAASPEAGSADEPAIEEPTAAAEAEAELAAATVLGPSADAELGNSAATPATPKRTSTRRAEARARTTARRAALAAASPEIPVSTSQDDNSSDIGRDPSHQVEPSPEADADRTGSGSNSTPQGDEGTPGPDSSHPEGERKGERDRAGDEAAEPASQGHAPTRRSQARSRATARRVALAAAGTSDVAPDQEAEEIRPTTGEEQPTTPTHAPTRRSQARARTTARRAALATAALAEQGVVLEPEPDPAAVPDPATTSKAPHQPTKRSQARSRSTARRASLAAGATSDDDEQVSSGAEAEPGSDETVSASASPPEPGPTPEHTPTKRSQGRARATARRAALAAATQERQAEGPLTPEQAPAPTPPGPEPAAAPIAAASAVAPEQRPARHAAKPKERDAILEAAMNLDNDQTMLVRMLALLARIGARAVADVDVTGLERIPRRGPVILAVNHISNADPVVVGAWITDALKRRRIHWLGKRELFAWPLLGWMAAHGGVHPVDRDAADVEAFRLATKILEAGYVLLVFPEGTRSPTGELQKAKDGVAMLALRTGAQVVPIGVSNTDAVWRKGRPLPIPFPRRRVTVRIGVPFRVQDVIPEGVTRREAKTLATTEIMGRIAALLDPRHRGVYATAVRRDRPSEP